jgi:hypothetical protein
MKAIFGETSYKRFKKTTFTEVRNLVDRVLWVVAFESWKNAVAHIIREELRKWVLGSVTDIVRDEADQLLSSTECGMEKAVYNVSGLRKTFVGILVLNLPNN